MMELEQEIPKGKVLGISPLYLVGAPDNRQQWKLMDREMAKVAKGLKEVEEDFLDMLFMEEDDEEDYGYQELYDFYSKAWIATTRELTGRFKLKYIKLNPDYFLMFYKPLEIPYK